MQKKVLIWALIIFLLALFAPSVSAVNTGADLSDSGCDSCDTVTKIFLSGEGKSINWQTEGISSKGFKVAWSKNEHPTYPTRSGDKYHYHSSPDKNSDTLDAFDGAGTYYVRVCEYLGGKCGLYSNEISLVLGSAIEDETENNTSVESIVLSANGDKITWQTEGTSSKGFKVVWSKNEHPTYPTRSGDKYQYHSSPDSDSATLSAFNGSGTYYVRVCEYLGGKCGLYSNELSLSLSANLDAIACAEDYSPVCGKDGRTYSNKCVAVSQNGVKIAYQGQCQKDENIQAIEKKAELLNENKLDDILSELKELRSLVREQQNQIKYLRSLLDGISSVTEEMQNSINSFITYGVDDNTKNLGAGERAAVMFSFKEAFGRLPENENELGDAIKIANGRWPSLTSEEAEKKAKEKFQKIYKRIPDMNDQNDSAAIKVMAYGLRQKARNRNLQSEENGIKIFQSLYGHSPLNTEEWNTMQAITYSGATRGVDSDGDMLTDERELELGTNPENPDSDNDGFGDGLEVANGYDPLRR